VSSDVIYDAFISYNQRLDKPFVRRLQRQLQNLGKAWWQRRAIRIFRDESSLSATPELWAAIERALAGSRYFILCASPEAAASHWVNKEVCWWLQRKGWDKFLIAVTAGDIRWDGAANDFVWNEATPLPPACKGVFTSEPKWIDFRAYRALAESASADDAFLGLAADLSSAIRGIPKEDLLSEEVRQQRRALQLAYAGGASLGVLAVLAGLFANRAIIARADTERTAQSAASSASNFVYKLFGGYDKSIAIDPDTKLNLLDNANLLLDKISAVGLSNDSTSQRARGAVQVERAQVFLGKESYDSAAAYAAEGIQQFKALLAASPDDVSIKGDLAVAYERLGRTQKETGRIAEAISSYNLGLQLLSVGPKTCCVV